MSIPDHARDKCCQRSDPALFPIFWKNDGIQRASRRWGSPTSNAIDSLGFFVKADV